MFHTTVLLVVGYDYLNQPPTPAVLLGYTGYPHWMLIFGLVLLVFTQLLGIAFIR